MFKVLFQKVQEHAEKNKDRTDNKMDKSDTVVQMGKERQEENGLNGRTNKILRNIYYTLSDPSSFSGVNNLYNSAREKDPTITIQAVKSWLNRQNTYSKHKKKQEFLNVA